MSCTSGCPTPGSHQSWGECMRSKNLRVQSDTYNDNHLAKLPGKAMSIEQKNHAELTEYRKAREQGLQPAGTKLNQIRGAVNASKQTGEAFRADR